MFSLLASFVLVLHLSFVLFVVFGGLLALRWRRMVWVHLPAVAWGVWIEWSGGVCPLTPLENALRERAGLAPYEGDFLARWVLPVLYPEGLTREVQIALGLAAVAVNVVVYVFVWRRRRSAGAGRA